MDRRFIRRAAENVYVQTAFHVAGGFGTGLFLAPFIPREAGTAAGTLLLAAAVAGHLYAVWSDPARGRSGSSSLQEPGRQPDVP